MIFDLTLFFVDFLEYPMSLVDANTRSLEEKFRNLELQNW